MNVSEPEADTEYSRAPAGSGPAGQAVAGASSPTASAVVAAALLAAALLLAAEFLPLFEVRTSARHAAITTQQAGSHHAYALIPIALLVATLALAWRRSPARLPVIAIGLLGVVALVIALGRDLPDAQATGIERAGGTYVSAAAGPRAGLYLETAGGVIALIAAAGGVLLGPPPGGRRADRVVSQTVRFLTLRRSQRFINTRHVTFTEREGCPTAAPGPVR